MRIIVVGSGGREHAIIKKIKKDNPDVKIFALPGNAGMMREAECVDIKATDIDAIAQFASENNIDYAIVAPDDPLVMGAVNRLQEKGIPCFGPVAEAAIIEGSKAFSKDLMKKYGIPTAEFETFDDPDAALRYLDKSDYPIVIKADGLALGKGVIIASDKKEAYDAVDTIMKEKKFGNSGNKVVIEEFLTGPEVSVLTFTDGVTVLPMISSMDHKRAKDNDEGLNTGGMGTVAPNPYYTDEIADRCMREIFMPTINAMNKEGRTFRGCLYFGLMITPKGPKVIEYNCRFGDPETQVVLPLLENNLLEVMMATTGSRLSEIKLSNSKGSACCVILASDGYPQKYQTGFEITVPDEIYDSVYYAGARLNDEGKIVTAGGRVIGVTAVEDDLESAVRSAYSKADRVRFENKYNRTDIGQRALSIYRSKNK